MKKTAVVYDKWLNTLGGGEVVACTIANALFKKGYQVTFICGKSVDKDSIYKNLGINMRGIKFIKIWNDEQKIKEVTKNKDLFINCTFMDYTYGFAKKNIFYTHFPTESYTDLKGMLFNKVALPILVKYIKPVEFIKGPKLILVKNNHFMYLIEQKNKIAFSHLKLNEEYILKFIIFYENFYKLVIENSFFNIDNAKIIEKKVLVDQKNNKIKFLIKLRALSNTVYLNLNLIKKKGVHNLSDDKIYLLYPKIINAKLPNFIYKLLYERLQARLRAGIFINIIERLKSYNLLLSNSFYTSSWIKKYWNLDSKVLYPPLSQIPYLKKRKVFKKMNWICNLGRFFTLGHEKKQEVLIEAFKKLYNKGYKKWQLHLIGGLSKNKLSIQFIEKLKKISVGYPIFFHINVEKKAVAEILAKSKIYWHATGFGENPNKNPIKFEHFGIAPIEAISAKCIPILFKGGGLMEIISSLGLSEKLHSFSNINDLINNTTQIIRKLEKKENLLPKELFKKLEKNFSSYSFEEKFYTIVKSLEEKS